MARITVEDCLKNVDNRFDLVIKSARRAHMLEMGEADALVAEDNDKPTVIALREIAAGFDITKTRKNTRQEEVISLADAQAELTQEDDDESMIELLQAQMSRVESGEEDED